MKQAMISTAGLEAIQVYCFRCRFIPQCSIKTNVLMTDSVKCCLAKNPERITFPGIGRVGF